VYNYQARRRESPFCLPQCCNIEVYFFFDQEGGYFRSNFTDREGDGMEVMKNWQDIPERQRIAFATVSFPPEVLAAGSIAALALTMVGALGRIVVRNTILTVFEPPAPVHGETVPVAIVAGDTCTATLQLGGTAVYVKRYCAAPDDSTAPEMAKKIARPEVIQKPC
jgi:hypothetical protein